MPHYNAAGSSAAQHRNGLGGDIAAYKVGHNQQIRIAPPPGFDTPFNFRSLRVHSQIVTDRAFHNAAGDPRLLISSASYGFFHLGIDLFYSSQDSYLGLLNPQRVQRFHGIGDSRFFLSSVG